MVDASGEIIYANRRAEELLGMSRQELATMRYGDADFRIMDLDGIEIPAEELPFSLIEESGDPVCDFNRMMRHGDGDTVGLVITGNPICDESE
jgi:PAS domain S-box-containing protein